MSQSPEISVVIVSYNTREMTLAALESVEQQTTETSIEVIVVDNGSEDGSAEAIAAKHPRVNLICSRTNLGFGQGNNLAAKNATGKRLLLLNPDTLVLDQAIDRLCSFADKYPQARMWGGRTLFADHSLNFTSCFATPSLFGLLCLATGLSNLFPNTPFFNKDSIGGWNRDSEREVAIISGCFMLLDREIWMELGGFSPEFFMYGEDWDLCLRARHLGARPMVDPMSVIVHYGGASERVRSQKVVRNFTAKALLFRRHWPKWKAAVAPLCMDMHALVRFLGYSGAGLFRAPARASAGQWFTVLRKRRTWRRAPVGQDLGK